MGFNPRPVPLPLYGRGGFFRAGGAGEMGLPRRVGRGMPGSMSALAYDTHRAVKSLVAAGFDPTRAEAVVATVGDAMTGTVATKADVAELRADVKADMAELRADVKSDVADVKSGVAVLDARITALQGDVETLKADVTDLKADGAALKTEVAGLRVDMSAMKAELYRLVLVSSVAIVGLTVALMKLIP